MLNRIFLIGNLTHDPEVRYLPSGTAVANFDIAVNERYRDRSQELREQTLFIRVETFDRQAETCAQYLKKGRRVFVEGRLRLDEWEGRDGTKRSRPVVRAIQVKFLDTRAEAEAADAADAKKGEVAAGAAPAAVPESDVTPPPEVPELDVNEGPQEPEADEGTEDDLPF